MDTTATTTMAMVAVRYMARTVVTAAEQIIGAPETCRLMNQAIVHRTIIRESPSRRRYMTSLTRAALQEENCLRYRAPQETLPYHHALQSPKSILTATRPVRLMCPRTGMMAAGLPLVPGPSLHIPEPDSLQVLRVLITDDQLLTGTRIFRPIRTPIPMYGSLA